MEEYWQTFFFEQDSKIICLEIDQKFLFTTQVEKLRQDLKMCRSYITAQQRRQVLCGLDFGPDYRDHVRPLFIDVLIRRFLLRAVTVQRLIRTPGDLNDEINKISLKPMEDYYSDLPACLADCAYVQQPNQINKMFMNQE